MLMKEREEGLRVAWCVQGGLGDALQAAPFMKRFKESFAPDRLAFYKDGARLDTVGRIIAGCLPDQGGPFNEDDLEADIAAGMYDLRIDVRRLPQYTVLNPRKIKIFHSELWTLIEKAKKRFEPLTFVFDNHAFYDGLFGRLMADYDMNVVESMLYYGGFDDARFDKPRIGISAASLETVQNFGLTRGSYITVHDGFDVFNALAGTGKRPTRAWPGAHWEALIKQIKAARPDLQIVQIGAPESSEYLYGVDHYLLGLTSMEDAIGVIDGACLHIDTEGGFVPCAWAMETPAISIQGPTGSHFYHYDGVTQIFDNRCHGCWWSTPDWMAQCPRDLERAECMHRVTPETVFAKAMGLLPSGTAALGEPRAAEASTGSPKVWGETVWGKNKNLPPLDIAAGQLHSVYWRGRRAAEERSETSPKQYALPSRATSAEPVWKVLTQDQFHHLMSLKGEDFVAASYRIILKREADPGGLENYTSALTNGSLKKAEILKALVKSEEFEAALSIPSKERADEIFISAVEQALQGGKFDAAFYAGLMQNEKHGYDFFTKAMSLKRDPASRRSFERALQARRSTAEGPSATALAPTDRAPGDALRVAVFIAGSLGDMLQQVPFINAFSARFRPATLDLYFYPGKQGPGKFAVETITNARGPFDSEDLGEKCESGEYDLRIDMKHVVKYHALNLDKIQSSHPDLLKVLLAAEQRLAPYQFIVDQHPIFDGLFGRLMAKYGMNAVEATGFLGGVPVPRSAAPHIEVGPSTAGVLARFDLRPGQYIVLHDGFDVDHYMVGAAKRPTKNWPVAHWERLAHLIKAERPGHDIVQIGHAASSTPLRGADVDLIGKTSLDDLVAILGHAALVVTSEGGILRIAWALDTPTLSLQGPSGSEFFQFGKAQSVISEVCNGCWFVLDEWMARCYRGYKGPACMNGMRPEAVMAKVHSTLSLQ